MIGVNLSRTLSGGYIARRITLCSFLSSIGTSMVVSDEIRAHRATAPVVALESTIITHGLPYPQNLQMAQAVETTIREAGAVPATCAFIDGVPHVGLSLSQLCQLAESSGTRPNKVSRRDIGFVMANRQNGGTTIALTMILAHIAGIKVFATGGLGGVHRDGQFTMDVSADLTELGKTPVAVVCAGPKAILDIPRTLEYLETQGVFVGTYRQQNVPGFYTQDSGHASPYSFQSFREAARVIHMQNNVMGLSSGSLFCIPPSAEHALPRDVVDKVIDEANAEAARLRISGKELTPFLLSKIALVTQGASVKSNIELVLNNARAASAIASELFALENSNSSTGSLRAEDSLVGFQPSSSINRTKDTSINKTKDSANEPSATKVPSMVNTVVVGSIALDSISKLRKGAVLHDSNPGSTSSSLGGVGYNLARACQLGLGSPSCSSGSSRLVSVVGDDFTGKSILAQLSSSGFDTSAILSMEGVSTAQYTAIHNDDGSLAVACADMSIVESQKFAKHAMEQIVRAKPQVIVLDCNLSEECISRILEQINHSLVINAKVIVEPTSGPKSARIGQLSTKTLMPFPNNTILLITPTVAELNSIYESFNANGKFDDFDFWFPLLDALGVNSVFRERLSVSKIPAIKQGLEQGYLQQAFQILPYVPNILLKLGDQGVLFLSVSTDIEDYNSIPTTSKYLPEVILTTHDGKRVGGSDSGKMGICIQYFPVPLENKDIEITNVTGAGDSLLGYLASRLLAANTDLTEGTWLEQNVTSVEQEWHKWESIYKSQIAAGKSLQAETAISEEIRRI